jgi:protoheme IX farnesyltransferase
MTTGPSFSRYVPIEAVPAERLAVSARLADYMELVKPRIAAMVLLTVTVGFTLGSVGAWHMSELASALVGVALVAAAGGAFNQLIERRTDALMARTANRPLPAGRLTPWEVAGFGAVCAAAGLCVLFVEVNATTALLSLVTLALYVLAYTPLKRHSALSTAVGAIPGALPPVLGWTAAGGALGWEAFSLFAILFLWQFPHFLAIAWLYRQDYAAAGLRMLPGTLPRKGLTGLAACVYAAVLIPVSVMPGQVALAGGSYRVAAVLLGLGYLAAALRFFVSESRETARGLLYVSLVYLPVLLSVLTWDHIRLLS